MKNKEATLKENIDTSTLISKIIPILIGLEPKLQKLNRNLNEVYDIFSYYNGLNNIDGFDNLDKFLKSLKLGELKDLYENIELVKRETNITTEAFFRRKDRDIELIIKILKDKNILKYQEPIKIEKPVSEDKKFEPIYIKEKADDQLTESSKVGPKTDYSKNLSLSVNKELKIKELKSPNYNKIVEIMEQDFIEIIKSLLNYKNSENNNILYLMWKKRNFSDIRSLFSNIPSNNIPLQNLKNELIFSLEKDNKRTVLHQASLLGKQEVVDIMLNNVSKDKLFDLITLKDRTGNNSLDLALRSDAAEIINLILEKLNEVYGYKKMLEVITNAENGDNLIHKAAKDNKLHSLQIIIGQLEKIEQLKKDELINIIKTENKDRLTAYECAARRKYKTIAKYLKILETEVSSPTKWTDRVTKTATDTKRITNDAQLQILGFKYDNNKELYLIVDFKQGKYKEFLRACIKKEITELTDIEKYGRIIYRDNDPISDELFEDIKQQKEKNSQLMRI